VADASSIVPRRAVIVPELRTPGATSATMPPSATVMAPALTMVDAPAPLASSSKA
jgi:hypothetical protein